MRGCAFREGRVAVKGRFGVSEAGKEERDEGCRAVDSGRREDQLRAAGTAVSVLRLSITAGEAICGVSLSESESLLYFSGICGVPLP